MVIVGQKFNSNSYGRFEVVDVINTNNVYIKFLDTGGVIKTTSQNAKNGFVKDPLFRSVCGVGYMGCGEYSSSRGGVKCKAYNVWVSMICRCYSGRYPSYNDCEVCDEWHNYQNFAAWFYDNYPNDGGRYELDKDIRTGDKGTLYSPLKCSFVTKAKNIAHSAKINNSKDWKFKDPSGKVVMIRNLKDFCIKNNLSQGNMHNVHTGKVRSCKGWTRA